MFEISILILKYRFWTKTSTEIPQVKIGTYLETDRTGVFSVKTHFNAIYAEVYGIRL